jgi:hypothetical protein
MRDQFTARLNTQHRNSQRHINAPSEVRNIFPSHDVWGSDEGELWDVMPCRLTDRNELLATFWGKMLFPSSVDCARNVASICRLYNVTLRGSVTAHIGRCCLSAQPQYLYTCHYFVAYLLKARTVKPEKRPLLGNARNIHARNNRGTVVNGM